MKKEKKLFKYRVYKVVRSDASGESIKLIYEGSKYGVSEKQIVARHRYTCNLYDKDNKLGSVSYKYIFEFYNDDEEDVEDTSKIREDLIDKDDEYTSYGYVESGIEFATDSEAYEYFRNL